MKNIDKKNIGNNIKKIRQSNNTKQQEFSLKCGISTNYLSQIESSKKYPSIKLLKKISKELGVTPSILIEDTPLMNDLRLLIEKNDIELIIKNLETLTTKKNN